jgi:feruloyl esterase
MQVIKRFLAPVGIATLGVVAVLSLDSHSPRLAAATACSDLVGLRLTDGRITSATDVAAPFQTTTQAPGNVPMTVPVPFCFVQASLTPSADSDIHIEVWLPVKSSWNGKFLGVGNGALTGSVWQTSMVRPLQAGYAVAGSNLGHDGSSAVFAFGHPEKLIDYANRGDHVTAIAGKAITDAYYGSAPTRSYFHGCSNGGHEALMEAQRYPDDYDAIIAGAPWNQWTHQNIEFIWRAIQLEKINPAKLPLITNSVVAQCSGRRDGGVGTDGYLNDPSNCDFKPKVLQCRGADAPDCLTREEVQAVQKIYAGPSNPETGQSLFPGFERGSEFGWVSFGAIFSNGLFQNMVFESNPTWDFHSFNFTSDVALLDAKLAALINSNNPDLSAFRARGGKLLMWHGLTDTTLEPRSSLNYYNSVIAVTAGGLDLDQRPGRRGGDRRANDETADAQNNRGPEAHEPWRQGRPNLEETREFFRFFMAPGVNHCGGGLGPNSSFAYTVANAVGALDADHDILAALDRWVEDGVAPDKLLASHFTAAGVADKTRPVCAYPQIARYKGQGDPNSPRAWSCKTDWDNFDREYDRELDNILEAIRLRTLDNLPN